MKTHQFDSTADAYDACQTGMASYNVSCVNGDLLVIESEGVVGVCDTWPVAVTVAHGELHAAKDGDALVRHMRERGLSDSLIAARAMAMDLGFAIYW